MLTSRKIPAFSKKVADLPDTPSSTMTAAQIKAQMDAAPEELRVAYNGAMDDLSSTTPGSSGAELIGSAPIAGVTGSTPYAQIADVKAQLNAATTGGIPDGSVTPAKLSFVPATKSELDTHTGATTAHGAVSTATANAMVVRDANGRAQFASPAAAADAATKGYVDAIKPITGTYTGNGAASRDIPLPFTPSAVYLNLNTGSSTIVSMGLALNGFPIKSPTSNGILIGANKLTVYYDSANSIDTNRSSVLYHYIAFP